MTHPIVLNKKQNRYHAHTKNDNEDRISKMLSTDVY